MQYVCVNYLDRRKYINVVAVHDIISRIDSKLSPCRAVVLSDIYNFPKVFVTVNPEFHGGHFCPQKLLHLFWYSHTISIFS